MYWRRLYASLPASQLGNTTIHYKLNNIYSWNLTATSSSFYLWSKVKYNILMLPTLIKSFIKYLSVTGCYDPIGQTIPLVNNPVSKVKLMRIIFLSRSVLIEGFPASAVLLDTTVSMESETTTSLQSTNIDTGLRCFQSTSVTLCCMNEYLMDRKPVDQLWYR